MEWLNRLVIGLMPITPKYFIGRVASRYIAGSSLGEAVKLTRLFNQSMIMTTIDLLGEHTESKEQAIEASRIYHLILDRIAADKIDANISLKPTHLGLKVNYDLCQSLIGDIVDHAAQINNFLRIDMEDRSTTNDTFKLYYKMRSRHEAVGVVIQAYLRRTIHDIDHLKESKANIRLCKGIYREPREDAYQNRSIIIRNYAFILNELLEAGCYVGIATHCEETIWHALKTIHQMKLSPDKYEFQMLLGVEEDLRQILLNQGHRLRVYVPFGEEWYAYSIRRLKENPTVAGHVMRDFLGIKSTGK